jgi:hypothetical protein
VLLFLLAFIIHLIRRQNKFSLKINFWMIIFFKLSILEHSMEILIFIEMLVALKIGFYWTTCILHKLQNAIFLILFINIKLFAFFVDHHLLFHFLNLFHLLRPYVQNPPKYKTFSTVHKFDLRLNESSTLRRANLDFLSLILVINSCWNH